ncbi:tetrahydrodipicolinate succinylase [Candidatus Xenohaliotis californiensis]|uniref:Tetrahydrodipicolinate succinylase n=1 Tax=Candidatus Xenohaliotis californiensis TaxID=84677 RepID=A0ABM9N8S4_9RICK|nr:tetrahydrodipicolinate succinylase [Candidatus Xenohaliotis californiensis]
MSVTDYAIKIEKLWLKYSKQELLTKNEQQLLLEIIDKIDDGIIKISYLDSSNNWAANEWVKKTILLYFSIMENVHIKSGNNISYDKIPLKFYNWSNDKLKNHAIRIVHGATIRYPSYIGKKTVIMPSFINVGAYIDDGCMIDTWATIGSCAYIGKNCHISGGAGIGGVLEPVNSKPTIIEDNCFIGARSEIVDGIVIGSGSTIAMGVYIGPSTKIVNRDTGEISYGFIPPKSVVVPGALPGKNNVSVYCVVIVKQADESTKKKVRLNELLRT